MHKRSSAMFCILAALALVSCLLPAGVSTQISFASYHVAYSAHSTVTAAQHGWHRVRAIATEALYTVRSGDSLSQISSRQYGSAAYWPTIYRANRGSIRYANDIYPGQRLALPAGTTTNASGIPMSPQPAPVVYRPTPSQDTDDLGTTATPVRSAGYSAPVQHTSAVYGGGYSVGSSFQACVIRAESGGNSQIWNASGHYGLYQFSASTWVAHGGNPADFGRASAAEQTQIFWNTVHADGTSDWAPYDGC